MRNLLIVPTLVILIAFPLLISSRDNEQASVDSFVSRATTGVHVDFDPLRSAEDAITKADLVIKGTLVGVADGMKLRYPDPTYTERRATAYMTLVVRVERVIAGNATRVRDGRVYLSVPKSTAVSTRQLAAAMPQAHIVAVLDDLSAWTPSSGIEVIRPAVLSTSDPLYAPYTDGLWLQASGDRTMSGLGTNYNALASRWGRPKTVGEFAVALERAAAKTR